MDMDEIKEIFFQECDEQLAELETGLQAISDGDDDPETVNAVFRAVHSIKGGAGAFALDDLVAFAHVFETTLDCVRSQTLEPTQPVLEIMLRSADVLADLAAAARDSSTVDSTKSAELVKELEALSTGDVPAEVAAPAPPVAPPAPIIEEPSPEKDANNAEFAAVAFSFDDFDEPSGSSYKIVFKPRADLYSKGNETAILIREIKSLGEAEVSFDSSVLPEFESLDPESAYLTWEIILQTEEDEEAIRAIFDFAEFDCELTITKVEANAEVKEKAVAEPVTEAPANDFDMPMMPVPVSLDDFDAGPVDDAPPAVIEAAPLEKIEIIEEAVVELAQVGPIAAIENVVAQASAVSSKELTEKSGDSAVAGAKTAPPATIRVDLERVDRLINLVGELVINQAMLSQSVVEDQNKTGSAMDMGLDELQQLTREIQDSVMAIRAQPVKPVFQRMSRIVRESAAAVGKTVRLITEGENTEVDKTVIDKLAEPLTHMIRNAVDHGLESPEKRAEAGKSAEGQLRLSAKHRSGRIVIEISDDGAGINRERVAQKAIENGLINADHSLSNEEIDNLIFEAGFSTAEKISDLSGRGVGMDVVKRSIQSLGGRISIVSTPGKGSVFTMSLPLTLAVLDGMVVTVAGQTLVVPLTAIVETLQPEKDNIHYFGATQKLIAIRDSFSPLVDVGRVLDFRDEDADPVRGVALLVESEGGGQRALMIDAIQGQRQVVIKSLESNYDHVPGIAAATILGDGRVALILDVDAVVSASKGDGLDILNNTAAIG